MKAGRELDGATVTFDQFSDDCPLKLLKPIPIKVSQTESDEYLVADELFNCYGVGESVTKALADYEAMVVCFYEDIVEWEGDLSQHLEEIKATLQGYVSLKGVAALKAKGVSVEDDGGRV